MVSEPKWTQNQQGSSPQDFTGGKPFTRLTVLQRPRSTIIYGVWSVVIAISCRITQYPLWTSHVGLLPTINQETVMFHLQHTPTKIWGEIYSKVHKSTNLPADGEISWTPFGGNHQWVQSSRTSLFWSLGASGPRCKLESLSGSVETFLFGLVHI